MRNYLRKAGEGIRRLDDAYSAAIANMYGGANPAVQAAAYMVGGAHPSLRKAVPEEVAEGALKTALEYGIPAMNAVPKYVLPTAGVALGVQGVMDIAHQLDQQTEGTI